MTPPLTLIGMSGPISGLSATSVPSYVTSDLVLNLDAGDSSSYGGSGTTWTDLSGPSNDASISNNTYNIGGSFDITSTSDNTLSGINLTGGSFSIEMWIYRVGNSHDGTEGQIFTQDSGDGDGNGWQWKITNSDAKVRFVYWTGSSRGTAGTIVSDTALSNYTWYQLVVTYDGTTIKMYQNNTEVHSSNPSSSLYGSTTAIGIGMFNQTLSYDQRFNGKIAIIRAYDDKSLTAAEVEQNYNATKGRYDLVLNLDAGDSSSYGGSGNTWNDLSPNGYNATRTSSSEIVYNSNGWFDWTDGPASDSTQGCFTIPGNSFTLGANFSIEVWNYYDAASTPNSGSSVNPFADGCLWTNSASADWSTGAANNNGILYGYNSIVYRNTSGTEIQVDYSTNPSTQNWHQHVLVVNSGTGTVYVDKVSVASLSNFRTIGQSQGTLGIGIADLNNGNYRGEYNGYISIVRIYTEALTATEVTQNFNAIKGRYGL